jgi:hypothetical protein
MKPHPLDVSQRIFWITAGLCLLAGTSVFSWQVLRGRPIAIEVAGIKFTTTRAQDSLAKAHDQLVAIRTTMDGAVAQNDIEAVREALDDLDEVLRSLGVARGALKRQQASVFPYSNYDSYGYGYDSTASYDNYYPDRSGYLDENGNDYGGYGYASPTIAPKRTP